jgi:arginyl-tRNA--protein-N-Asp/Glu arginylyltransferase
MKKDIVFIQQFPLPYFSILSMTAILKTKDAMMRVRRYDFMKKKKILFLIAHLVFMVQGCTYTQEDYDLQEKYIERQRQEDEARTQDAVKWKW